MTAPDIATAQHEAAHVVVGVALGLRLREARLEESERRRARGWVDLGWTEFYGGGPHDAWILMYAAGVAWERMLGGARAEEYASGDLALMRRYGVRSKSGVSCLIRAAGALLREVAPAHTMVTRALLERGELGPTDVEAMVRGERPGEV